jgi:hypothetical protein
MEPYCLGSNLQAEPAAVAQLQNINLNILRSKVHVQQPLLVRGENKKQQKHFQNCNRK